MPNERALAKVFWTQPFAIVGDFDGQHAASLGDVDRHLAGLCVFGDIGESASWAKR